MLHTSTKEGAINKIERQCVLPLFYRDDLQECLDIIQTLYLAGIRVIEFTNRGPFAVDNFSKMKRLFELKYEDLLLGIGTIKTKEEAELFLSLGADFIVSPVVNTEISRVTQSYKKIWIPGCMTPTEIEQANANGARLIKLFPAGTLGHSFIKSVKELFPEVRFIPTGGIGIKPDELKPWFSQGVAAVGIGSALIHKKMNNKQEYQQLYQYVISLLTISKNLKQEYEANF